MSFWSKAVAIAALTLALTAPLALAQEEGVTVDPGSPAGKEYALPIDQARRDAADGGGRGGGGGVAARRRPTPAFGEGVRPDSGSAVGRESSPPGGTESSPSSRTVTASSSRSASLATTTTSAQRAWERDRIDRALVTASVGGGASQGSLVLLVGGVVVMVVGVAAGFALRRRTT